MEGFRFKLGASSFVFLLILNGSTINVMSVEAGSDMKNDRSNYDFYFVQLMDTHVMSKVF
jgi:hypothetical protein